MVSLVHSPGFANESIDELGSGVTTHSERSSFFRSLPPERVGLSGEYDHSGLAKRVAYALHQTFSPQELEQLKVTQRGRVVVLAGYVDSDRLLHQFVVVAASISGADTVETLGVKVKETS